MCLTIELFQFYNMYLKVISVDDYQLYAEDLSWDDASSSCEKKGGSLPSILSKDEARAISEASDSESIWIGARRGERLPSGNDPWEWSDGSPWFDDEISGLSNWWQTPYPCANETYQQSNPLRCDKEPKCVFLSFEWWYPDKCDVLLPYVCHFSPTNAEASYDYTKENVGNSINIFMDLSMDSLQGSEVPGFKVTLKND